MINHRNKHNYRFRTWKIRDRCHRKGGVRQGCFQSLILNYLIQYIHFHSLYITSHYHAKFKENPCVGTDARPPLRQSIGRSTIKIKVSFSAAMITVIKHCIVTVLCIIFEYTVGPADLDLLFTLQ